MTSAEKIEIKDLILQEIRSESTDINELDEDTSLDGINSLPAMNGRNLVSVPLSLLKKGTDAEVSMDQIDFDRSKCAELINLNTTTYYNVYKMFGPDKASVGTMICFSDDMTHVLTQVLFSHFPDLNNYAGHKDSEIYVHYRSFNYKRSTLDIPAYTWSSWKLLTSSEFNARFIGEASDSSADTDPFIVLGRFSKESTETIQAFYDRVNAAIDGTFSQDAGSENKKYCGDMRVFTNGVRTNIHQYVINFDAGKYVQVADGTIDVDANGKLLFSRDNYKVFSRLIEGGVAGSWTEFGGRDSSVLDIGTFDGINAACAYAARSEIAGNRNAVVLIFHIRTPDPNKTMQGQIFQQWMHDDVSMQIRMYDRRLHRRNVTGATGIEGDATNAFSWEEFGVQKLQYDSSERKLTMKSYENGVIAEVTLPEATSQNAGLMTGAHLTRLYNTLSSSVGAFDADISATTKNNPVTAKMVGATVQGGDIVFAWHKLEGLPLTSVGFLYRVGLQYYAVSPDASKPIPDKNGLLTNRDKTAAYLCVNDELVKLIDIGTKQDVLTTSEDLNISSGNVLSLTENAKKKLFIDLWNNAGIDVKYDPNNAPEESRPFYINRMWLNYQEALNVFLESRDFYNTYGCGGAKTNILAFNMNNRANQDLSRAYRSPSYLAIRLANDKNTISVNNLSNAFSGASNLREILGVIDVNYMTKGGESGFLSNCRSLETVKIVNLKVNISFKDCKVLSQESLLYLIQNAANSSPITVTLHPDVYAKVDSTTIQLAAEKQITLATTT